MELFNGDCRLLSSYGAFPEGVTPFPQNSDLYYDHSSSVIQPPGCNLRHHFPPQKLRPIRCNGRKMPGYANPMENGIITRNLSDSDRSHSFELGFLPQLPSSGFLRLHQQEIESGSVGGSFPGVSSPHPADGGAIPPVESETTEAGVMTNGLNGQTSKYVYSSSPSNGTGNPAHDTKEPPSRKRKRKRKKENLEKFLESLMMQVINKQEQMHRQLIEMIEKKEAERVIREEAWKQQEMERAKREEEIRALETSRSLALISFIQNVLEHEIQILQPLQAGQEEDDGETQSRSDIKSEQTIGAGQNLKLQALITLGTSLDHDFGNLDSKVAPLWQEISVGLPNI